MTDQKRSEVQGAELAEPKTATHGKSGSTARWAILSRFTIIKDGEVYLDRLRVLQTPWFGVYLHRIAKPDADRDPHDHPWTFLSCVLRGGYEEDLYRYPHVIGADLPIRLVWRRWTWHRMDRATAHSIRSVKPRTVTLVLVGHRCRDWGFWTADGWVAWRDYLYDRADWSDPAMDEYREARS